MNKSIFDTLESNSRDQIKSDDDDSPIQPSSSRDEKERKVKLKNDHLKTDLKLKKQELELRKTFSKKTYFYNSWLTICILSIIFLCATDGLTINTSSYKFGFHFTLNTKVQIALISLLAVNSIGMLVIILKNLFPDKNRTK